MFLISLYTNASHKDVQARLDEQFQIVPPHYLRSLILPGIDDTDLSEDHLVHMMETLSTLPGKELCQLEELERTLIQLHERAGFGPLAESDNEEE